MRLLVTGAAGFIGSNFVHYWLDRNPDDYIVALDALTYAGNRENLSGLSEEACRFVHGDICDGELMLKLLTEENIDCIVNFAAESHNSLAILNPGAFFRTNVLGTQTLLEAARQAKTPRFHHISTCEVYGDLALDSDEQFFVDSPYRPRTPYNASKAGGDHAVRSYFETFHLPVTISNCCNNYGPWQYPEKLIPLFTTLAMDDQSLPLYESAENKREWIHVEDHCRAVEAIIKHGTIGETYNVGTGREASVNEIADIILDVLGKGSELKTTVPDRPGHDRRYLLNSDKITNQLGWRPQIVFETGMKMTINWYRENREWWLPLRDRAPVVESGWKSG
ncbi:MAG: dTDP-glucose 4,6-dehydratase [Pseudomonadales bacterium]|nr:dTDP-glucose 4,6-dehydratase [Pseudomonadales bacterium]